jgi:hypothetical protein
VDIEAKAPYEDTTKLPTPEQDKIIFEMDDLVKTLESRLGSVLLPAEPTEESIRTTREMPGDEPVRSPLAGLLANHNSRIVRVNNRIKSLLNRLEC